MSERPRLAVLGAINVDLVASGAPLPGPGQTVTGATFSQHQGGKGGNQAVAAARSGANVWLIGAIGDDQLGATSLEALAADGIRTDHVLITSEAPTGTALIAVDAAGENQITVAPGANRAVSPTHVVDALEALRPDLLLMSMEIAEPAVRAAIGWSVDHGVPVIVNPAPWQPWAHELIGLASIVTPNEVELAEIGVIPDGVIVIETRGARGVSVHERGVAHTILAPHVAVVDMTGAGDCFNGVLAARIASGRALDDAITDAIVAGALSVTRRGAREGMPDADAIAEGRTRFSR